jgi:hypothetical protein
LCRLDVRKATLVAAVVVSLAAASVAGFAGAQRAAPRRPWIGEACKQEFSTLCGDLPLNSRREEIIECLKKHPENLSNECSEAISDRPEGAQTPGQGMRGRHRGRGMGDSGSFGRGPYEGSSL